MRDVLAIVLECSENNAQYEKMPLGNRTLLTLGTTSSSSCQGPRIEGRVVRLLRKSKRNGIFIGLRKRLIAPPLQFKLASWAHTTSVASWALYSKDIDYNISRIAQHEITFNIETTYPLRLFIDSWFRYHKYTHDDF